MNPQRWALVERLFDQAVALAPPEREAWLERACAGDPALLREVESLLRADARAESRDLFALGQDAGLALEAGAGREPQLPPGTRLGPYRVVRLAGRGGMSEVYLGERDDEHYRRQVAIKVLRRGMAGRSSSLRFRTECQILASLDHPNIARLYDAGELDDGGPYLVMELVDGVRIDQYCCPLPLSARLRLFQKVCAAVHYAHQHLVVHRDIKPSNILVTADGEPKLLDFGIAKLLAPDPATEREATLTWMQPMTPEYASPEQVLGSTVTTASDVYSLGMLLYKLLVGRLPYAGNRPALEEVRSLVTGPVALLKPSTAARPGGFGSKQLRGDLDSIALMALQRRPEDRYSSAERLADDVERHLRGRPVRARAATFSYRAGRFLRRNWLPLSGVAAAVVILVSLSLAALVQAAQVRKQRQRAEEILAFFVDLFEVTNPDEPVGDRVTVRQVLARGVDRARRELEPHPDVQTTILDTLGVIYGKLGLYDEAIPLVDESLASRRTRFGPEHPDVAASLHELGALLRDTGEWARSESLLRQALEIRRRSLGNRDPAVADTLSQLVAVQKDLMRFDEAEGLAREALAIRRRAYGDEHRKVLASLHDLASILQAQGRLREAEPLLQESLLLKRRLLGEPHPEVAVALRELATLRYNQGRHAEAEPLFRDMLRTFREVWGDEHPEVALAYAELARDLEAQGKLAEAEESFRSALALFQRAGLTRHPDYATMVNNLASLKRTAGDFAAAEELFRQAYALRLEVLGEIHPYICQSHFSLADVLHEQGELGEAEQLYRQALRVCAEALPAGHHNQSWAEVGLGRLLADRGELEAAEPLLRQAVAILKPSLPAGHWRTLEAESALGHCLALQGRTAEAAALLEPPARQLERQLGAGDRRTLRARAWLRELRELAEVAR